MKKICIAVCLLMLSACEFSGDVITTDNLKVINVKVGAMDHIYTDNDMSITVESDKLVYKKNGQCKTKKQTVDCMWWGLQLQYSASPAPVILQCDTVKVTNSEPDNPRSLFPPSSVSYRWKIELPANTTAKSLVYFVLPGQGELTLKTHCEAVGIKPVDFSMTISFLE
jgi:hypothetical protein